MWLYEWWSYSRQATQVNVYQRYVKECPGAVDRTTKSFFAELQEIYDEIGVSLPPDAAVPRPQELDDDHDEIESSGLFEVIEIEQYDWETVYDAEGYIDLLNTFSGHIAMQDWQRNRLYGEIRRRLADRPDGRLRRHWVLSSRLPENARRDRQRRATRDHVPALLWNDLSSPRFA